MRWGLNKKQQRKIILSCSEITIQQFINCMFRSEYECLVVSGEFTKPEIHAAWSTIFEEYASLTDNMDYKEVNFILQELLKLQKKQLVIKCALVALSANMGNPLNKYQLEIAENVRRIGFNLKFDTSDDELFVKDLNRLIDISKNLGIAIEIKVKELDDRANKSGGKESTEADFMDNINIIAQHCGYAIDIKTTTIADYASKQRIYSRFIKKLEAERNKK